VDRLPTIKQATRRCPRGQIVAVQDDQIVVRLWSGEVCVMPNRCPHDGGPLADGFVEGDRLVCARHQWELDPRTGARCA
jgi:nitrite reductase/ring-hydroxylating ferredoxin subunit